MPESAEPVTRHITCKSAERTRRYRAQRKQQTGCRTIRLSRSQAEKLVRAGYLGKERLGDRKAEEAAIEAWMIDEL